MLSPLTYSNINYSLWINAEETEISNQSLFQIFVFQCGIELGETLLNLSRAWEQADTSTSFTLVSKLPKLEKSLTDNAKSGKKK